VTHHSCSRTSSEGQAESDRPKGRFAWFLRTWFTVNTIVAGLLALIWLILRSGPKPSRFAYPCQQAAFSAASLAFAAPLISALVAARRGLVQGMRTPAGVAASILGLLITLGMWGHSSLADDPASLHAAAPLDYRAQVFRVTDCPQQPSGDRFIGLDNLLTLMGSEGLKFYRSAALSMLAGPDGIIATDDVVVVKINYQWEERGGTNTDLLRGLIRAIVDHPDTFTGEVVVCENAQFRSVSNFDRSANNAQNTSLSPHDVVVGFQALGYNVSHYDWTSIRYTEVDEYSDGDTDDGYIVYDYDPQVSGRVSYPKFQTDDGTYVSLRDGIWDPASSSYDRDSLKFINLPVLKSHHATYGVTACVKHYMGVVTRELGTNSHGAIGDGLLGALVGEIRLADLNILDCIWVNANPNSGPGTSYGGATRLDQLVASTDPVAADILAATEILIPAFIDNGYSPPWPYPSADPSLPSSAFRLYLDNSMDRILDAGYEVTNDLTQVEAFTWDGVEPLAIFADGFETGNTNAWTVVVP
jgi:uncharacterized protein (DUF362 family)